MKPSIRTASSALQVETLRPAENPAPVDMSLIVCTLGRSGALTRLLESLHCLNESSLEIIVVDQNEPGFLDPLLAEYVNVRPLVHIRSARGLSRARNAGLRRAAGAIVGIPDDDCWYDTTTLPLVCAMFRDRADLALLSGRTVDRTGRDSITRNCLSASGDVDRTNVFLTGSSSALFIRRSVALEIGGFDETLGVGAGTPFQSGEETDLILRCLAHGYHCYFSRELRVFHDQIDETAEQRLRRASAYSPGFGRLLRKHRYGLRVLGARVTRASLRGAFCIAQGDLDGARERYRWAIGCISGYAAPLNLPPIGQPPRA